MRVRERERERERERKEAKEEIKRRKDEGLMAVPYYTI